MVLLVHADGANDADGSTSNISDWHLKAAVPYVEGLTVAYGESTTDFALAGETDDTSNVGHILIQCWYHVSVGYRMVILEDGTRRS